MRFFSGAVDTDPHRRGEIPRDFRRLDVDFPDIHPLGRRKDPVKSGGDIPGPREEFHGQDGGGDRKGGTAFLFFVNVLGFVGVDTLQDYIKAWGRKSTEIRTFILYCFKMQNTHKMKGKRV